MGAENVLLAPHTCGAGVSIILHENKNFCKHSFDKGFRREGHGVETKTPARKERVNCQLTRAVGVIYERCVVERNLPILLRFLFWAKAARTVSHLSSILILTEPLISVPQSDSS
jgi:hypothetical protein